MAPPRCGEAGLIAERRQESIVHLSKYAVDAGKKLADSKGNLDHARKFQAIATGRANVFPEEQTPSQISVNVLGFAAVRLQEPQEQQESG